MSESSPEGKTQGTAAAVIRLLIMAGLGLYVGVTFADDLRRFAGMFAGVERSVQCVGQACVGDPVTSLTVIADDAGGVNGVSCDVEAPPPLAPPAKPRPPQEPVERQANPGRHVNDLLAGRACPQGPYTVEFRTPYNRTMVRIHRGKIASIKQGPAHEFAL